MAYKKVIKEHAKELALQGRTIPEISNMMNVPESTLARWKQQDRWEEEEKSASPLGLVYKLQIAFNNTLEKAISEDKLGDPAIADTLTKLAALMEKVIPKRMMLANILNMLTDVVLYLQNHVEDDDFKDKFAAYIPEIAEFLKNKYTG